jgi:hypothetical protein
VLSLASFGNAQSLVKSRKSIRHSSSNSLRAKDYNVHNRIYNLYRQEATMWAKEPSDAQDLDSAFF